MPTFRVKLPNKPTPKPLPRPAPKLASPEVSPSARVPSLALPHTPAELVRLCQESAILPPSATTLLAALAPLAKAYEAAMDALKERIKAKAPAGIPEGPRLEVTAHTRTTVPWKDVALTEAQALAEARGLPFVASVYEAQVVHERGRESESLSLKWA